MTAEQYVVRIIYQTPPYANTGNTNTVFYVSGKEVVATSQSNTVFYVSGKEVYATSPLLLNARKYESIKSAKAAIAQRMRYGYYFKDAKFEIVKVEVTVKEINIVTEKE
jgi:hypothetical protein